MSGPISYLETVAIGRLAGRVPVAIFHTRQAKERRNEEIISKIIANEQATQEPCKLMTDSNVDMILFYEKDDTCIYFGSSFRHFSSISYADSNKEKLTKVMRDVEGVKHVMEENIENMLAKQEKLEDIDRRAGELNAATAKFRKTSRSLKNTMCMRRWKIIIILVVVVLAILGYIGIAVIPPLVNPSS
ncbi:putative Synaptobrevin [Paratrimastix pyriformis]|uniref:Synaptobrevin n=1 Tax=Paratrimastix pyriformis TaxID=342808 RepID=A0ABQ8U978_9EUKA|nr:putative Synaptobrevin [Paratrimastix pyriformis]